MGRSRSFALLLLLLPVGAGAFPELVRHGYANCISCHEGPNGGGLMTAYGRSLSQDVLSTWGREGESKFLYGLVRPPEWLNPGGEIRAVQTYMSNPALEAGQFILMQADAAAAVHWWKLTLVGTAGYQNPSVGYPLFSRVYYLNYRPTDEWSIRGGKFQTAYGINTADHIISIKKGLGWDEGTETFNIEGAYLGERVDGFLTLQLGRPDAPQLNREVGFAARSSVFLDEKYKVGGSYYFGSQSSGNRHVFGPYGILGFTHHFFILAELDLQNSLPTGANGTWGGADYLKVDYELIGGLHFFVTQELVRANWSDPTNLTDAYGIGVQFFPRPHFEFAATYQKVRMQPQSPNYGDYAWLLLHYYL